MDHIDPPREETIDMTPQWPAMRAFVLAMARTDAKTALKIAAEMGNEGPSLRELADAANQEDESWSVP